MINMFNQAFIELKHIWDNTTYAEKKVKCTNMIPDSAETPYSDYKTIQDLFDRRKKSTYYEEYKDTVKFLMRHCIRRKYYLHFKKCLKNQCTHCKNNISNHESINLLKDLSEDGSLPIPKLYKQLYNGEHYPSFLDIITDENLKLDTKKEMEDHIKNTKGKDNGRCSWCSWYFLSKNDYKKHRDFCP